MTEAEDPYVTIRVPDDGCDNDQDRVWAALHAAIRGFDEKNSEPLISLLLDDDQLIRCRGLYIFGSLGKRSVVALDAALRSIDDTDVGAKSNLMDGIICYPRALNSNQVALVLKLADDPEDLVRHKVVVFLGAADREVIGSAIELLDEPLRSSCKQGFLMFDAMPSQAQMLFDQALTETSVVSTFALASIEKMARENRLKEMPKYDGESYLGRCVLANVERLKRRRGA